MRRICMECGAPFAQVRRETRCPAHARPVRKADDPAWRRVRREVLERDGRRCRYCGDPASSVDHVVPVSRGGSTEPGNLVAACRWCNTSKGDRLLSEWSGPRAR